MNQESRLLEKLTWKQNLENVKALFKIVSGLDKYCFSLMALCNVLKVAAEYGALILSAYIVDGLAAGTDLDRLLMTAVLGAAGISAFTALSHWVQSRVDIRREIIANKYNALQQEKVLDMDFAMIDSPRLKEIKDRIRQDNNWFAGIYSLFFQMESLMNNCLGILGAVAAGASVLGSLKGKSLVPALAGMLILTVIMAALQKLYFHYQELVYYSIFHIPTRKEKEKLYTYTWAFAVGQAGFQYKNGKDVRVYDGYGLMKYWTRDRQLGREYQETYINQPVKAEMGAGAVNGAMPAISSVGAYMVAVIAALAGGMPAGAVVLFAGCLSRLVTCACKVALHGGQVALTARRQEGIMELLKLPDEMYKGSLPVEKRSDHQYQIEFCNVSFRYPGTEAYVLKNFSLKLNVGEKLAIVGRNGSGKTTMIKLLCRLYDPDEGEILVNGVDIRKFRQEEYAQLFSVVFQDFVLFSLMLAENVAVSTEYEEKKLRKCLEDAGFGERLKTLEQESAGIRSYLNKDYTDLGIEVSGGEAQKLAIARAIYKDAPFVLLDEPTAALDPLAEAEIYENFDKIVGDKTAVYISHRLSSCRFCEKIAVFDKGELVQTGSHEELLAQEGGVYAALWNAQAKYYEQVL